jgi:hypothetical protein
MLGMADDTGHEPLSVRNREARQTIRKMTILRREKMYKSEILCEAEEKIERRKCSRTERMCSVCEGRIEAEKKRVEHPAGNTR